MANLALSAKEVLALYELLLDQTRYGKKDECYEAHCIHEPTFHEVPPLDVLFEKVKSLLAASLEQYSFQDKKETAEAWLKINKQRIEDLKKANAHVNNEMREIKRQFVTSETACKVDPVSEDKADPRHDPVKVCMGDSEDLLRELDLCKDDKDFIYPKPSAPRPVMPQHQQRFRGKRKK
jgi:hypothetical protein